MIARLRWSPRVSAIVPDLAGDVNTRCCGWCANGEEQEGAGGEHLRWLSCARPNASAWRLNHMDRDRNA
jgi:hypothetical protein